MWTTVNRELRRLRPLFPVGHTSLLFQPKRSARQGLKGSQRVLGREILVSSIQTQRRAFPPRQGPCPLCDGLGLSGSLAKIGGYCLKWADSYQQTHRSSVTRWQPFFSTLSGSVEQEECQVQLVQQNTLKLQYLHILTVGCSPVCWTVVFALVLPLHCIWFRRFSGSYHWWISLNFF